jgi:hypothetical protein
LPDHSETVHTVTDRCLKLNYELNKILA